MALKEDRPAGDIDSWSIPGSFEDDGVLYPGEPFSQEALTNIKAGNIPEHEVTVATYPRSGTARLLEICWLLLHDCNTEETQSRNNLTRYIFLELSNSDKFKTAYKSMEPPIVSKTHVGLSAAKALADTGIKIVLGIRNPKDTLISYYHFNRMNAIHGLFPGNWRQFMDLYKQGKFPYGDYFDNVLSWWALRDRPNVKVVRFEDFDEKPFEIIKEMSEFLGQKHSDDKLQSVVDWVSFNNMRSNSSTSYSDKEYSHVFKSDISPYMRKGTTGDWKHYFSEEDNCYVDELCAQRCTPVGLEFKFEK